MDNFALSYWHWFALGLLLLMAEMAGTGGYLLWVGIAAGFTGAVLFLLPSLVWETQLLIFSVASVVSALLWWQYQLRHARVADEPLLNKRAAQYVGRILVLAEPIENGHGKVRVDDSFWAVSAEEDLPAGTRVKVLSLRADQVLCVEKMP